eukprot:gnl/TRDRNA2_/TRDRNA2_158817_c0_seq2.p1 gnl/TRDRNA2_/TRDRNA2_158817_c0~~gnl/TRDRNA2_/TRDRNA2_158817_c0_seq2.p1  ORF type:complete len:185 (+),score=32.98 gnl/TRDRNA2_/TRDRNA2_158817_c0_seq2:220-774(+)
MYGFSAPPAEALSTPLTLRAEAVLPGLGEYETNAKVLEVLTSLGCTTESESLESLFTIYLYGSDMEKAMLSRTRCLRAWIRARKLRSDLFKLVNRLRWIRSAKSEDLLVWDRDDRLLLKELRASCGALALEWVRAVAKFPARSEHGPDMESMSEHNLLVSAASMEALRMERCAASAYRSLAELR